ncbi:MAG TPA: hypothetical protein EYG73_00480 [Arcobacter sp.]|nr:hypothetical protein [Arcobacter sp.]
MKYFLLLLVLLLIGCGSKHKGHIAPIPNAYIAPSIVQGQNSQEYTDALALGNDLVHKNSEPIYLFIEDGYMKDESGNGAGTLPVVFKRLAMFAAFDFRPKIHVYTSIGEFAKVLKDPKKRDRAFEIEGIISAYDENKEVIDSGIDFGLDFGNGKGSTDLDNKFRNTDKVSSLTLDIMFKQNGQMYTARSNTLDINYINRGYSSGLRINNSGFGTSAYHTKKEGIGKTLKRLLHASLHSMIQEVVQQKSLIPPRSVPSSVYVRPTPNRPVQRTVPPVYNRPSPIPRVVRPRTLAPIPRVMTPIREYNAPPVQDKAVPIAPKSRLNNREESFLNRIKQREGNR